MRTRPQLWTADLAGRSCWFRVVLHLVALLRRWRNRHWHWRHILQEFDDHKRDL